MHRKLCWIEVDEEGLACLDLATTERACQRGLGLSVGTYLAEMPDATEEVVEAVADALVMAALTNTEIEPYNATAEARDILRRLASAPPNKETTDGV